MLIPKRTAIIQLKLPRFRAVVYMGTFFFGSRSLEELTLMYLLPLFFAWWGMY